LIPEQLKRAPSIRQPLSELILRGDKTLEFRSRLTRIRERVYLYAGKNLAPFQRLAEAFGHVSFEIAGESETGDTQHRSVRFRLRFARVPNSRGGGFAQWWPGNLGAMIPKDRVHSR
jgi:hypothetical protein